jgi:uncharacterized protein YqeY
MASIFRQALRRTTALSAPTVAPVSAARPFLATPLLRRPYSTEDDAGAAEATPGTTEPPFMQNLRQDLKAAMRERDQIRLDVIRGLIAETNTAAKTPLPIETDVHLIRLMRRTRMRQADAAAEFMVNGRKDLAERELAQMGIIKQYEDATGIKTATREEISKVVSGVIADITSDMTHASKLDMRTVIVNAEKELKGRDVLKSDLVFEANHQIKSKRRQT